MTITVSTDDKRAVKALAILANAGSWLKIRTRDGKKYYGVPSETQPGVYYATDCHGCDCPDFLGRLERGGPSGPCKHSIAVQLHCARVNGRAARLAEARRRRSLQVGASPTGTLRELALSTCAVCGKAHSSDQERRQAHAAIAGDVWGRDGD